MIAPAVLAAAEPLVLGIPGGGCSPLVFARAGVPGATVYGIDWARAPGPWDLESVAGRIIAALRPRTAPTILAGHSLGGVIAMLAALAAPDRVAGLLLIDTGAAIRGHADPDLPARVRRGLSPAEREAFLDSCFMRRPDAALWSALTDYFAALDPEAFLQSVSSVRSIDLTARLAEIACPTAVLHGRHDRRRNTAHARTLAAGIAGAELRLIESGHTPMVDNPPEFNAALARLLERL